MTDLTPEQDIKAQLVVLSLYLQCPPLQDAQIRLYAQELEDLGPDGLRQAIVALKADETLYAGRFPLPAKIRSYLHGDINTLVSTGLARIMAATTAHEIYRLPREEYEVVQTYGIKAVLERSHGDTATIYAQLRDALRVRYMRRAAEARLGLSDNRQANREQVARTEALSLFPGEGADDAFVQGQSARES